MATASRGYLPFPVTRKSNSLPQYAIACRRRESICATMVRWSRAVSTRESGVSLSPLPWTVHKVNGNVTAHRINSGLAAEEPLPPTQRQPCQRSQDGRDGLYTTP